MFACLESRDVAAVMACSRACSACTPLVSPFPLARAQLVRCSAAQLSRLATAFRTARAELTVPRVDSVTSVERRAHMDSATFRREFLLPNAPVITGGLADDWACVADWTTGSAPNYAWLEARFGEMEVTIKRNAAGSGSGADVPE